MEVILSKFIFPQNYNFKSKLFGIIDYSTATFNVIWIALVFLLLKLFSLKLKVKVFIMITLCLPILIFSITGLNGENIFNVLYYILKYVVKPKAYVFKKIKIHGP